VPPEQADRRLDVFLVERLPECSRVTCQRAIEAGHVRVNGAVCTKPSFRLQPDQRVEIERIEPRPDGPLAEDIALAILYEDASIVVVNKPAGMIVHPAKGHWDGTLANALSHHFGRLSTVGGPTRPGIVHRLDRDTSGVIVAAKTDQAHEALADQFQARRVAKEYLAIVVGVPNRDRDVVEQPIGDHPTQREKKAILADHPSSRDAVTYYEVVERFVGYALVRAEPKTGRTHQIRLHLAHIGCPVLCDRLYGGRARITETELMPRDAARPATASEAPADQPLLDRQALHAHRISLAHPTTGEPLRFEAPLPDDMLRTLDALRRWRHL
jgi:23S rRNA pseudouridine1911/1915/1917 synthase